MAQTVNTRKLALDTLLAVSRDGRQSHLAVSDTLEMYRFLPERERAFYVRLVEGTLENRLLWDHYINAFSSVPTARMKPAIREILRMAVCQLRSLSAVPASAAVNEAVKLTSQVGLSGLRGFVNAVLRNIAARGDGVRLPGKDEPERYLSVRYSVPDFLAVRWLADYGPEKAERIAASFLEERRLTVRLRPEEETEEILESLANEGVEAEASPLLSSAYILRAHGSLRELSAFRSGKLIVQDASSQLAVRAAGIRPGSFVLDLCAAPGGKSMLAADLAGAEGKVIAADISARKVGLINENIRRCGFSQIEATVNDATVFVPEWEKSADLVIADLPCSGYGVIGRKPEIKYRSSEEKERELAALQRQILENAVRYLKDDGTLLYSTCTFTKTENEENAAYAAELSGRKISEERQLLPGLDPCDGFYYAVIR